MTRYQCLVLLCDEKLLKAGDGKITAPTLAELQKKTLAARQQTDELHTALMKRMRKIFDE